jgi:hypothetical protein
MAGILGSMSSMLTPDVLGKLGKGLGLDPSQVDQGMKVAGPLVAGMLAKTTSTSEGARGFADLLSSAESAAGQSSAAGMGDQLAGLLGGAEGGNLGGMLDGVMGLVSASGGTGADMMQGVLGQGVNAIGGTLSSKLGFDVKPLLGMAVPAVVGLVNKAKKEGNLDADGIAKMLQSESKAYMDDPANKANVALINEAMEAGDKATALRGKFNDADWKKIRLAPVAAAYLVAKASPSKGTGALKEMAAATGAVSETVAKVSPTSLVGTAFGGGLNSSEWDALEANRPSDEQLLAGLTAAKAAVAAVSASDAAAFGDMITQVATRTAEATKEGGFLGIGGKQVSDAEQAALAGITAALK